MAGSGDKTEKPTAKKRRDSRQKGQVAKSQDLTGWASLVVGLYLVPLLVRRTVDVPLDAFDSIRAASIDPSSGLAVAALGSSLRVGLSAILPFLGVMVLANVAFTMSQTGLVLAGKALKPDVKRLSPKQGIKRLFSTRTAWETAKQVLKISIVLVLAWPRLRGMVEATIGHGRLPLWDGLRVAGGEVMGLTRLIAWTLLILALADYGYQRFQHQRDMRMTKQEVRDEYRNSEGDAQVKGRIRSLQRSLARNRMLADVGDADVVITNPTHVAVALRYDPKVGGAPVVLATGANSLAAKIRERAIDADVPIVEAKPLARALWRACDPGDQIPVASYEAVAQVLAFVRRLDRRFGVRRRLELPAHVQLGEATLEQIPRKRRRR